MGSRSTSQFPLLTDYDVSDRIPLVRDLGNGTFENKEILRNDLGLRVFSKSRLLTSAEILELHTTPIEVVPAFAGGTIVPLFAIGVWGDGTTDYDTNVHLIIGDSDIADDNFILFGSIQDGTKSLACKPVFTSSSQAASTGTAKAMKASIQSGDPLNGDRALLLTVYYNII